MIFLIRPVTGKEERGPWSPWYDKQFGIVCRADSQEQARAMAAKDAGDEGKAVWLDPAFTECINIDNLQEGGPAVLLRDFASA
jgi:hypothetical protein